MSERESIEKEGITICSHCGERAAIIEGKAYCFCCCSPIKPVIKSDNK